MDNNPASHHHWGRGEKGVPYCRSSVVGQSSIRPLLINLPRATCVLEFPHVVSSTTRVSIFFSSLQHNTSEMRPFSFLTLALPSLIIASHIKLGRHARLANSPSHDHEVTPAPRASIVRRQAASFTSPSAPQQTGTIAGCSLWAVVKSGDTCETLASSFGIPRSQFLAWNPAVSSNCETNFWLDYAYCVRVGP